MTINPPDKTTERYWGGCSLVVICVDERFSISNQERALAESKAYANALLSPRQQGVMGNGNGGGRQYGAF